MNKKEKFLSVFMGLCAIMAIAILTWYNALSYFIIAVTMVALLMLVFVDSSKMLIKIINKKGLTFFIFISIVAAILWISVISYGIVLFIDGKIKQKETINHDKTQHALEVQADFAKNAWFELSDTLLETNHWSSATVLEQRPLIEGLYQTKVLQERNKVIFLALTDQEIAPGEKVEIAMFQHQPWQGSFESSIFILKEKN